MMSPRFLFCLFVGIVLSGHTAAFAESVNVQFSVVGWGSSIPDLTYRSGGKDLKVAVPMFAPSRMKKYSGDALLEFRQNITGADGKTQRTVVASVPLNKNQPKILILLNKASDGRYQAHVLPDDPQSLPPGMARIFNFTTGKLAIRCNHATGTVLAAGESNLASPANGVLLLEVAQQKEEKWTPVLNNYFPVSGDNTARVFLLQDKNGYFQNAIGISGAIQMVVLRPAPEGDEEKDIPVTPEPEPAEPTPANSGILPP